MPEFQGVKLREGLSLKDAPEDVYKEFEECGVLNIEYGAGDTKCMVELEKSWMLLKIEDNYLVMYLTPKEEGEDGLDNE